MDMFAAASDYFQFSYSHNSLGDTSPTNNRTRRHYESWICHNPIHQRRYGPGWALDIISRAEPGT
jgi:hypothetical protein